MKQVGIVLLVVLALGFFAWALVTTDSEGGVAWTATLVACGVVCLALAARAHASRSD